MRIDNDLKTQAQLESFRKLMKVWKASAELAPPLVTEEEVRALMGEMHDAICKKVEGEDPD